MIALILMDGGVSSSSTRDSWRSGLDESLVVREGIYVVKCASIAVVMKIEVEPFELFSTRWHEAERTYAKFDDAMPTCFTCLCRTLQDQAMEDGLERVMNKGSRT